MRYRVYQQEDFESICNNYNLGFSSQLVIQATGLGKTRLMSGIPYLKTRLGLTKKTIVIVNRVELVEQTKDEFIEADPTLKIGVEQATNRADKDCDVVIVSIQTVGTATFDELGLPVFKKRTLEINPDDFDTVLVDETHRAPASTFRSFLMYLGVYKDSRNYDSRKLLLGFTATPNRTDNKGLEEFYECVACNRDIVWGINNGWLTDIHAYRVSTSVNLDDHDLKTTNTEMGKDFSKKELEKAVNIPARNKLIIERVEELREGGRGVFFCVDVQHAKDLCQMANDMGMKAKCVFGETSKEDRREIFRQHQAGEFTALMGVNVFCLDSETEILTRGGWKGIDEISYDDQVANWDNWNIFFDKPKQIFKRDTFPGERMVSINSRVLDMRLTPDHNFVYIKQNGSIHKDKAINLVEKNTRVPVSGNAKEEAGLIPEPEKRRNTQCPKQRLRCNRFFIKKETGMSEPWVTEEAKRRMAERDSMRYKTPEELTDAECFLIGFWIGDGGVYQLKKGGREHKISQADSNMWATDLIRNALTESGIKFNEKHKKAAKQKDSDYTLFSFSPGTGSGNQKINGCYAIEPYFKKDGSDLFWGLNQRQFDQLIYGLWASDGNHGDGTRKKRTFIIHSTNKKMLDLIQAIATCRGYASHINKQAGSTQNPKHNQVYNLHMAKVRDQSVHIGGTQSTYLKQEESAQQESVWCVKSTSGNIIARRNGKVFVTGNCEGYNDPGITFVAMCRPTQSKLFYQQAIGRALRPSPAPEAVKAMRERGEEPKWIKPYAILIDFCDLSSKHHLVTVGSIFGLGSKFDFKGKSVTKEAAKMKQEISKLDQRQQAEVEKNINDIASIEEMRSIVERVDLFKTPEVPAEVSSVSNLEWHKIGDKYEISLPGKDVIRIKETQLGEFTVERSIAGNVQEVARKRNLENAIKWAEDNCIPDDAFDLLRAEAVWKTKRPSRKQTEYLSGLDKNLFSKFSGNMDLFHSYIHANYSKGQVASMITEALAKKNDKKESKYARVRP